MRPPCRFIINGIVSEVIGPNFYEEGDEVVYKNKNYIIQEITTHNYLGGDTRLPYYGVKLKEKETDNA